MNLNDAPITQTYVTRANALDSAGQDSTAARTRMTQMLMHRTYRVMNEVINWAAEMDAIKKHVFYGKPMPFSVRTASDLEPARLAEAMSRFDSHEVVRIFHAMSGLVDESAELLQILYNHLFGDVEIDWDNLDEECGDSLWYMALLAKAHNYSTFDEFMMGNMAKLEKRYGGTTWNQDGALNRDKDAEIAAMKEVIPTPDGRYLIHPEVEAQLDPKTVDAIKRIDSILLEEKSE